MKIYCLVCKLYVGDIKDAKLRKGISYLCKDCTEIFNLKMGKTKKEETPDFLSDLLKGFKL